MTPSDQKQLAEKAAEFFAWRRKDHHVDMAEMKNHDLAEAACKSFMEIKL